MITIKIAAKASIIKSICPNIGEKYIDFVKGAPDDRTFPAGYRANPPAKKEPTVHSNDLNRSGINIDKNPLKISIPIEINMYSILSFIPQLNIV